MGGEAGVASIFRATGPGRFANRSHALATHTHTRNPKTTHALPTKSCHTGFHLYTATQIKQLRHPDVLPLSPTYCLCLSTIILAAHEQFPRLTEASHQQIMGVSNAWANTFVRQIIYSSSSTKTLYIPDRLIIAISVNDAASQAARHNDPAPLTDKTNVYQINSSRRIIEQTIKGFVDTSLLCCKLCVLEGDVNGVACNLLVNIVGSVPGLQLMIIFIFEYFLLSFFEYFLTNLIIVWTI